MSSIWWGSRHTSSGSASLGSSCMWIGGIGVRREVVSFGESTQWGLGDGAIDLKEMEMMSQGRKFG